MSRHQIPAIDRLTHNPDPRERLFQVARISIALILLLTGAWYVLTGLLEIINFGWRQPMFDQFKMYPNYLELPFPRNALQLENGHRPILPIMVRIAEANWFSANQVLQLAVGGSCAFLMAAILAMAAWRAPNASLPIRAACVATACIGIFWLGNARMLLHGNELLHVYLLGLFLLLGAMSVHRAAQGSAIRWMSIATACSLCATFCFGPGIAAFPALAIVAWYSRIPLRAIAIMGLGIAVALITYLWILPDNEGVRGMLVFRPLDSIATAMRWIASPWINAWLGYADPPLYPWMTPAASPGKVSRWLSESASAIQSTLHIDMRQTGALVVGLAGFAIAGTFLVRHAVRREPQSQIRSLGLTLVLFTAAISVIIGIGRLSNFSAQPDQVFADRYLPWSCMFWIGLAILLLLKMDQIGRSTRSMALVVALILPFGLAPSQRSWAGWGEVVYRNGQQAGAAAISNVYDARVFPDDESASTRDVLRTLDLLRERHLSMYSTAGANRLGEKIPINQSRLEVSIRIETVEPITDARDGQAAAHIRGIVTSGIRTVSRGGTLVIVDGENRIVGFALPSFVGNHRPAPRKNIPRKRGFDGYIHDYSSEKQYRLALLDPDSNTSTYLAPIPAEVR
jgi:hypothetical protein